MIINGPYLHFTVYQYGTIQGHKMISKYKILFTIPNFDTAGSGKALLNICRSLDKNYFKPHISCSHSKGFLFEEVIESGIPYIINENQNDMIPRLKVLLSVLTYPNFSKNWK